MTDDVYKLEIFGLEFSLTTKDGNKDELRKVAEYYKKVTEDLQRKSPNLPHINVAVLAGLTLTDELYNLAKSKSIKVANNDKKVDELINEAIKQLEFSINM